MSKSRLCKIIPAQVTDVVDGCYIVNLPDGDQYKVEGGNIPMKKGTLVRFGKDSFLKLMNEIVVDEFEEITVLKDESNDLESPDTNSSSIPYNAKEKNYAVWQDAPTRLLIDLYKEFKPEVNGQKIKTMRNMWEKIADRLKEEGYTFDHQQVESKWKSLVRSYRTSLMQGGRRKAHYQAGPFEQEIGEILTSQGVSFEMVYVDETQEEDEENNQIYSNASPPHRSGKLTSHEGNSTENTVASGSDISMLIQAIDRRTKQKEAADRVKHDQREKLISAIQERNQLMKKLFLQKENR